MALAEVLSGLHDERRERLRVYSSDLDVLDFDAIWMPALVSLVEVCRIADALATSERIGAPPHVARTSADYARMLLARGAAGDAERAQTLLAQERSIAERIGQRGVLADVVGLVEQRAEA